MICQTAMVHLRLVITALFAGGGLASGTGSWIALAVAHDAAVQMIDTSIVRVHQHGACITNNNGQHIGRSGGSSSQ